MKTYWLQGRDSRTPLRRLIDPPLVQQEIDPLDIGDVQVLHAHTPFTEERRTGVYSPITFQDVARRSIANSPVKYPNTPRGKQEIGYVIGVEGELCGSEFFRGVANK